MPASSTTATLTVALAGNPNSGKTTIFNALTGLRQKVANYPGVTVEKKSGRCKLPASDTHPARWINIIDLPGTYSLISRSPDEHVAMEVLRGLRSDTPAPDVVVVVVDASNLQRNLYIVSQLIELGRPLVVALNMMDVAERRGIHVSPENLEKQLGVPVVPIVGHRRKGISNLKSQISNARVAPMPDWPLPEAMKEELLLVGGGLAILDVGATLVSPSSPDEARATQVSPLQVPPRAWICRADGDDIRRLDRYQTLAERLLIGDRAADVADIANKQPVASLLDSATHRLASLGIDPMHADVEAHYHWIEEIVRSMGVPPMPVAEEHGRDAHATLMLDYAPALTLTDKVDAILIHKVWGLLIFAAIMASLFASMFWLADPIMGGIESAVAAAGSLASSRLPDGPVKDLITDGIFAGVGAVVVFVPQIALLFFFLAILEDSGYLARAAFLMDKLLAKVGLHGKSFIPLLSSFACAIPGIMATRTIEDRRDRLATIFVAPFMSCSARLPVYTLLIGAFFAAYSAMVQAGIMLALYGLGILAAAGTAWVFKRSFLKGPRPAFILELPTYKVPQASQVARQVWFNTSKFLTKAGTIIFCLSVILWAMTYYPRLPEAPQVRRDKWLIDTISTIHIEGAKMIVAHSSKYPGWENWDNVKSSVADAESARSIAENPSLDPQQKLDQLWALTNPDLKTHFDKLADQAVAAEQLRHSIAGRIGHFIEPAIRPLGYDWKMGVGLVGAFAAREVFVSTMGIIYSVGEVEDETVDLQSAMQSDVYPNGRPVWTPLVAVSLLVWFVLAMQCMSTLAIVKRETAGWKWPLFMLLYMNALAYVMALGVYQIGWRLLT